jgi:hypothetical protein
MPTTRRRRANPPEQPEQASPLIEATEQANIPAEAQGAERKQVEAAQSTLAETKSPAAAVTASAGKSATSEDVPGRSVPEENVEKENVASSTTPVPAVSATPYRHAVHTTRASHASHAHATFASATPPATPVFPADAAESYNGSNMPPARPERQRIERQPAERTEYPPSIESGRRTARGELFRRPPQPPAPAVVAQPQLQPPSHEITLPLGNLLHLAYNPSYTGSEEARSTLLQQLASESKAGGRARCWSCGSLAIAYDRWLTKNKSFGEVGIAFCEICGVWSVM